MHRAAHTIEDVSRLGSLLTRAELLVRLNPLWEGTLGEVDRRHAAAGARRLMLPMFRTPGEVAAFDDMVAGRVPVTLLVETAAALSRLAAILPLLSPGDRVHFGLNDLALDMKLSFLFEVLEGGLLDGPAALAARRAYRLVLAALAVSGRAIFRRSGRRRACPPRFGMGDPFPRLMEALFA